MAEGDILKDRKDAGEPSVSFYAEQVIGSREIENGRRYNTL